MKMKKMNEQHERIEARIKIIRSESKQLSAEIYRRVEQRKKLSEEKRRLKLSLFTFGQKQGEESKW
jgi:ribosomal protein L18E